MRRPEDALRSMRYYTYLALEGLFGDEWEVRFDRDPVNQKLPFARVTKIGPALYAGSKHTQEAAQPMAVHVYTKPPDDATTAEMQAMRIEEALYQAFLVGVGMLENPEEPPVVTNGPGSNLGMTAEYAYALMDRDGGRTKSSPWSAPVQVKQSGGLQVPIHVEAPARGAGVRIYRKLSVGDDGLVAVLGEREWIDRGVAVPNTNEPESALNTTRLGAPRRIPLWSFEDEDPYSAISDDDRALCDYMRVSDFSVDQVRDPDDDTRIMVTADIRVSWHRSGRLPSSGEALTDVRATYTHG